MIKLIVELTNLYAVQVGPIKFSGKLKRNGTLKFSQESASSTCVDMMYWSVELWYPPIADVMTRNHFKELNWFLQFNDKALANRSRDDQMYDRYHKVRPLLTMMREACLLTEPEERMSVDEPLYRIKTAFDNILLRKLRNGASKSKSWQDVV